MANVQPSKKHRVWVSISPCDCQHLFIAIFIEVTSLQCLLCELYSVLYYCTCYHLSHLQFHLYKYNTLTSNKRNIKAKSFKAIIGCHVLVRYLPYDRLFETERRFSLLRGLRKENCWTHAVNRRPFPADTLVQSKVIPCGICGVQCENGARFSLST
jgi:hypothetical protein